MKVSIELEHPQLIRFRVDLNKKTLIDSECKKIFKYTINIKNATQLETWFWPWGIKPILRLDGHMMNYSILDVNQFDHMLSFTLYPDYLERYGKSLIQSRINTQFPDGRIVQKIYDSAIGYGNTYSELTEKIKASIQ